MNPGAAREVHSGCEQKRAASVHLAQKERRGNGCPFSHDCFCLPLQMGKLLHVCLGACGTRGGMCDNARQRHTLQAQLSLKVTLTPVVKCNVWYDRPTDMLMLTQADKQTDKQLSHKRIDIHARKRTKIRIDSQEGWQKCSTVRTDVSKRKRLQRVLHWRPKDCIS